MKISVECNAFDVNEDKQRQCYKQLKCFWPKCRYINDRESELNRHILHHLNKRQFFCDECNKQFYRNSDLLNHKRNVHQNFRPYICQMSNCNKGFNTEYNLIRHKLTHYSVWNFNCDKCDKKFKSFNRLKNHNIVHINVRPFICHQKECNKSFKSKGELIRHNKTNSSEKIFECNECHKRFRCKKLLIAHKVIHSDEKPFICNVNNCRKRFKQRSGLFNHKIRIHSGIKRHKCSHNNCNKGFYQATGIGGRGYFWYTPLAENFSKIPPWRFWVKPPFCFLNERKTLKFTLI